MPPRTPSGDSKTARVDGRGQSVILSSRYWWEEGRAGDAAIASNMCVLYLVLRTARRRYFAGAERGSRFLQGPLMCSCGRVRAAEDAPRDPFRLLERRHGLAQIVERGIVVLVGQAAGACGFRGG